VCVCVCRGVNSKKKYIKAWVHYRIQRQSLDSRANVSVIVDHCVIIIVPLTHSLTHLLTYSLTYSLIHSLTPSLTHSPRLQG
jgi:hypothetical protein